jgi:hypothetical protein
MARIRKWQETLMVACAALFFSVGRAWPLGARDAASHEYSTYSHLVVRTNRKTALGVELATRGLYIRLIRTSLVPVAMPLAAGAYVATAAGAGNSRGWCLPWEAQISIRFSAHVRITRPRWTYGVV